MTAMISSDSEEELIEDTADDAIVPERSRIVYEKRYKVFCEWMAKNNKTEVNETLLLAFFNTELKNAAPTTKWTNFSILKAMLKSKKNVDIGSYQQLLSFLKKNSKGYKPVKSKVLQKAEIFRFVAEADDFAYLDAKVLLIVGISGACRKHELVELKTSDVLDLGTGLSVDVRIAKTGNSRRFLIGPGEDGLDFVGIVKKYIDLRPSNVHHDRFFLNYQKGRCTRQPIGINKISGFPKIIATFLGLPNPQSYTGHCFRRTSATLQSNACSDLKIFKTHGSLKSSSVAESNPVNSLTNKRNGKNNFFNGSRDASHDSTAPKNVSNNALNYPGYINSTHSNDGKLDSTEEFLILKVEPEETSVQPVVTTPANDDHGRDDISMENSCSTFNLERNKNFELTERNNFDRFDHVTSSWAGILRNLPRTQQIFAEKLINDVLFEAQLDNLSRQSVFTASNAQNNKQNGM